MFGAIWGDIVGSPYEFDSKNYKAKDFPWLSEESTFTDDSVMTIAVSKGFLDAGLDADDETVKTSVTAAMREIGRRYPCCGYGRRFIGWMFGGDPRPYNSLGNGSAMRVSSVAWLYDDLASVRRAARLSAVVTHDHPEGVKGAEAVASAIFLARTGHSKEEIRDYVTQQFGYDLTRTCDQIRPDYHMDATCPGSVPEAIIAFLEGTDFEDTIRTAVSLGGDSDTIAAIAGSMAEGFCGLSEEMKDQALALLPEDLRTEAARFRAFVANK